MFNYEEGEHQCRSLPCEPRSDSRLQPQNRKLRKQNTEKHDLPPSPSPYLSGSLWEEKSGVKEKALPHQRSDHLWCSGSWGWTELLPPGWRPVSPSVRGTVVIREARVPLWTQGEGPLVSEPYSPAYSYWDGSDVCPSWLVNSWGPKESLAPPPRISIPTPRTHDWRFHTGHSSAPVHSRHCSDWWAHTISAQVWSKPRWKRPLLEISSRWQADGFSEGFFNLEGMIGYKEIQV